jgi:hypothetical protein
MISKKKEEVKPNKLKTFFLETKESDIYLEDNLDEIDYYGAMCKGMSSNRVFRLTGYNVLCTKYKKFKDKESVLMIFCIPSQSNSESKNDLKHVSEKVMDVIKLAEEYFITIDFMSVKDVKEDKFTYLTILKII